MPLVISTKRGRMLRAGFIPPDLPRPTPSPSDSGRVGLPRTRSFQRQRPLRLWWIAVAIAVIANVIVVIGLSQVSHLHQAAIEPPLAVRSLRQVEPDQPPPPPPEQTREASETPPEEAVAVALPSLDLPSTAAPGSLALPAVGSLDPDLNLPVSIPAFTAIGTGDGPPVAVAGPVGPPAFDTPAERESTFDLDRYYPRAARLRGVEGTTHLRFSIDPSGRVTDVQVLDSTPQGVFEEAADRIARAIRYRPAQAAGKPVASVQTITIDWTIRK